MMIPRSEKRALRVTTGIASQASAGLSGPPVITRQAAIRTSAPTQAANITYSGRSEFCISRSAAANMPATSSEAAKIAPIVGHPSQPVAASVATTTVAIVTARTGFTRRSISSRRSRSISLRISQELVI